MTGQVPSPFQTSVSLSVKQMEELKPLMSSASAYAQSVRGSLHKQRMKYLLWLVSCAFKWGW